MDITLNMRNGKGEIIATLIHSFREVAAADILKYRSSLAEIISQAESDPGKSVKALNKLQRDFWKANCEKASGYPAPDGADIMTKANWQDYIMPADFQMAVNSWFQTFEVIRKN